MCGILGSINRTFDLPTLDLIRHRGPDDFGLESSKIGDYQVRLGQRRLSIIDLSAAGHQPMSTECEDYQIIFNGEVYNYLDLQKKLPEHISFQGHSDTETILYYLKEFGIEGVKDFNGIFAFAFLDKKKQKIYLARDPFGVKPLYFFRGEHKDIVFSSEIGPLKSLLDEQEVNKSALATLLRLRFNPAPATVFSGIQKLRPGHFLEIDLGNGSLNMMEQAFLDQVPVTQNLPKPRLVNGYGEHMEKAVKRQLLSDVEVGILLSGGIDSAVVAALAQKNSPTQIKAFTVGFEGEHMEDEIEDAAETADLLGLEHHYKKISFSDFLGMMESCTRIVEEPLATTSMIPMYFLAELAASKVKVVLTGQGADEPLGGYTRYKSELIQDRIPAFLKRMLPGIVERTGIRNEKILRGVHALKPSSEIDRFLAVYETFRKEEIENLIGVEETNSSVLIDYFYDLLQCQNKTHSVERMMALDARLNLADDLLNYTDKITMHFSLECRVPMLDLELVRYIESLPLDLKLNWKGGKIVHKQFARDLLPERIINRKKKGFQSPTQYWFRKDQEAIREILLKKETPFAAVFNQQYVSQIIDQHVKGYNREKQIFLLLGIYFWLKSL